MKTAIVPNLLSVVLVVFLGKTVSVTGSSFPPFTCNVLQFPGNGCTELDIPTMELSVSTLFVTELDSVSVIYFTDYLGDKQDVFVVDSTTGLVSYKCSSSLLPSLSLCLPGGGRRLANNICTQPNYCKDNKQVCIMAGCPTPGRRRLGAQTGSYADEKGENRLLGTFNITKLTLDGTAMIQNIITLNPFCKPKELGFRCDLV